MIGTIAFLLALASLFAAYVWAKRKLQSLKIERAERLRLRAKGAAKTRRPVAQRLLGALPAAVSRVCFRWRPSPLRRRFTAPVTVARRGVFGRRVKISLLQHVLVAGQTGSGKSSTQRVLAAHVLRAADAVLEVWDMKRISALRDYRGRARTCTTTDEVADRLADLIDRELITRADKLIAGEDVPYLVIMIDEAATLLRDLSARSLGDLVSAVEMGRELRVFFVMAVQQPLASNLPTKIRSQLSCVIAHRLKSARESEVVFPGTVGAGWAPHLLGGPGTCLVWTHDAQPRPAFGYWLAPARFKGIRERGPVTALGAPVSLVKHNLSSFNQLSTPHITSPQSPSPLLPPSAVRPSVRHETPAQARRRTQKRTDGRLSARQAQALAALDVSAGPIGAAHLARELGIERNRAHEVLRQLTARGLVTQDEDGAYTLTTAPQKEQS